MKLPITGTRNPSAFATWPTYEGVWPCRVVDANDPLKAGRVKIRIFQLHGDATHFPDEFLPWVPTLHSMAGIKHGALVLPEEKSDGWVAFFQGNNRYPVFLGEHYGTPKGGSDVPDEFFEDYPNVRGYVDPAGFSVLFNATQKTLRVADAHGNVIVMNAAGEVGDGAVEIRTEDPFTIRAVNILSVVADEDMSILAKKNLEVTVQHDATVNLDGKAKVIAKNDVEVDADQDVKVSSRYGDITLDARVRDIKLKARNIKFETTDNIEFNAGGMVILDG